MGVFDRQIASAKRMIEKNGQLVTWRQILNGEPLDPAMPWKPGPAVQTDTDVRIAFFTVDRVTQKYVQHVTGTVVPMGSEIGYMAQVNFAPAIKDVVLRGSEEYAVANFDKLDPNGEGAILYILEFER